MSGGRAPPAPGVPDLGRLRPCGAGGFGSVCAELLTPLRVRGAAFIKGNRQRDTLRALARVTCTACGV